MRNYLKIWIDILTPKQLLFAQPIIDRLGKRHNILCTSRKYNEVSKLAQIRNFELILIGRHGGAKKADKLQASIKRMEALTKRIQVFAPDLLVSFCSPEAARVAYGLGIRHVAFCDSPHATAVMQLTIPLIQKLLIPFVIPKDSFAKYGIQKNNIIQYGSIDAFLTIQRRVDKSVKLPFKNNNKKNILVRVEEEEAAYTVRSTAIIPIIKKIAKQYKDENIVILGRYSKQVEHFKKIFGSKVKIIKMSFDGKHLLNNTDVFIGSGGTMTAESALMGVPTISYNTVPNLIEDFLVKKHLIKRETSPDKITNYIKKVLDSADNPTLKRAARIRRDMKSPIKELIATIYKQ